MTSVGKANCSLVSWPASAGILGFIGFAASSGRNRLYETANDYKVCRSVQGAAGRSWVLI